MTQVAWQGWQLQMPPRWSPMKLEGDYREGYASFADLLQQRLGLRWKQIKSKRLDVRKWASQVMRDEVGRLAADEAREVAPPPTGEWGISLLYQEPEPPGRDLWVGYSQTSQRAVVLAYHTRHRDQVLRSSLMPSLEDAPADQPMPWAVFELSCIVPPGFSLMSHRLNAGDLSLLLSDKRRELLVRQIAVAQLALKRMPLEKWLLQQHRMQNRYYRSIGKAEPVEVQAFGERRISGFTQERHRRRRYFWMRRLPRTFASFALHDEQRDRLVIVEATDEPLAREVVQTVGWAKRE